MAKRSPRAKLVRTAHGMRPAGHGWFILNTRDAIWYGNGVFGAATLFEDRKAPFSQVGINVHILLPGEPNCHYHAESAQEDFLVLSGRCRVLIDGKEVLLKPWDLVHCPPWTDHVFVGAGKGPCVILMVGARPKPTRLRYPRSALAMKYRASSPRTTSDPAVSYAKVPRSVPVPAPPPFGRRTRMR